MQMYPDAQMPPPSPQKRSMVRRIVLVVGITLLLIGSGLYLYRQFNPTTCFTAADYAEFYGTTPSGVSFGPKAEFFSATYPFLPSSATLDNTESDASPKEDSLALAAFYKKHPAKQIAFVIHAAYASDSTSSKAIAEKRAGDIKTSLTNAGIAPNVITTTVETYNPNDERVNYDDIDNVSLVLASAETCRE